jgi:hypothetical protein
LARKLAEFDTLSAEIASLERDLDGPAGNPQGVGKNKPAGRGALALVPFEAPNQSACVGFPAIERQMASNSIMLAFQ